MHARDQPFDVFSVPAGMGDPYSRQVQPQGQGQEPVDHLAVQARRVFDFSQEARMLEPVLLAPFIEMAAQVLALLFRVRRMPDDGIEFMIAHHGPGRSGIDHAAHDGNGAQLLWAAVDEVAHENGPAPGMAPSIHGFLITELSQQGFQLARLPVNVANDVIRHAICYA